MATGTRARDWAEVDYYAILGVPPDAGDDDIGRAFRALAKQLHPDAGTTAVDVERFKDVARAYEVLGDPRVRRDYDTVRSEVAARRAGRGPTVPADYRPVPAFATAKAKIRRGFTRRRAWIATVGGVVCFAAGIGVSFWTLAAHNDDARRRADTIEAKVTTEKVGGTSYISFVTATGESVRVRAPNLGEQGRSDVVRYYPDDPQHVVVVRDTIGRDITLGIVALKLVVSGPILTVLGLRRLRRAG